MVRISTNAVALLEESRRRQEIPDSHGVRIFGEDDGAGGLAIRLAFTEEPNEGDQVLEEEGTEFYIATEVTEPLEATVIDVGEGDPPGLVLRPESV